MVDVPLTQFVEVDGLSVAYQVSGSGPVDLVWVPGLYSHLEAMYDIPGHANVMARLESICRVIAFDRRGTGMSDRLSTAPSLEERMRDVGAVMTAAGSDHAFLLGVSEGGPMSLLFAATYPDRVPGVILSSSYARFCRSWDYPIGPEREEHLTAIGETAPGWGDPDQLPIDWIAPSRKNDRMFIEGFARANRLAFSPKAMVQMWELAVDIDVRHVLPAVAAPVLVLHKQGDSVISADHGRYLAKHLPNAALELLPGADHPTQTWDDSVLDTIETFITGREPEPSIVSRSLAAVLFTDIVGSTELATRLGDKDWSERLDRHDTLTARLIERFGGRLIKTTGDGAVAVFEGPASAIACAAAIRDGVHDFDLQVRAGLHLGEIETRGDDIAGIAVHLAARIMSAAAPDEILVSRTLTDVVAGSPHHFDERGAHDLKGISGTWELYALTGPNS
ncbi:MAG: class 3 adenylate cyclase/pimeloyl-ACP methyl ester carboxylesterase [Candidatus Poriferisodalaceae bacterium]|jgi:class 3 adenylate cyclase/pimeloyl-ACP methyl ester carboxylesterase